MIRVIREHITVEQERIIEIHHSALTVGTKAEVIILVDLPGNEDQPLVSFLGKGKGCFASAAEVDSFLRKERNPKP